MWVDSAGQIEFIRPGSEVLTETKMRLSIKSSLGLGKGDLIREVVVLARLISYTLVYCVYGTNLRLS